ncbi:LysR family transcriptional regulator [uncultured Rhodospira sp.]|uniref:LysR family transcriptional regulator n=1 Tax=uncultured Rhodospira sp. TaxID=1936189 RepID=UPI00263A396A|nr:LysR family transcriptional regulator [uncultured Rhodospira sp.]
MVENREFTVPARSTTRLARYATLRQLQIFSAIVRLGSFTKASEALFVTQPTVSMQMKKLSTAVGVPLFEQVGRTVRPTEAGLRLEAATKTVFEALGEVEDWVAEYQGLRRGKVRLAVITTAKYFAPELLGAFSREYPDIDLSLKVSNRDRVIERIRAQEDDLYIFGQPDLDDLDVAIHPFAPNPLVVVAARDHPLAGRRGLSLAEVAREPFILREPGSGTRHAMVRAFSEAGVTPTVRMELGSNEAIKHAAIAGLGLAVLSLHSLSVEGARGPLAVLDVEGFPIHRRWWVVHARGRELSPAAAALLAFTRHYEPVLSAQVTDLLAEFGMASAPPDAGAA